MNCQRDFLEVEVDSLHEWMRRMTLSEGVRTPCHWMGYDEEKIGRKWLFRGQANAGWKVESTLERTNAFKNADANKKREIEKYCIDEFKRRSCRMLSERDLSPFDWVALMRHHGAPARLIDFTYSAYVALYFAVNGGLVQTGESDFAVWAISLDGLDRSDEACTCEAIDECDCKFGIYKNSPGRDVFCEESFGAQHSRIYLGVPEFGNERSNAQSGAFLFQVLNKVLWRIYRSTWINHQRSCRSMTCALKTFLKMSAHCACREWSNLYSPTGFAKTLVLRYDR